MWTLQLPPDAPDTEFPNSFSISSTRATSLGRNGALVILHSSISRQHGTFTVSPKLPTKRLSAPTVDLFYQDSSSYGTHVNGTKLAKGQTVPVNHGDSFTFGKLGLAYHLVWVPLVFCHSRLSSPDKRKLLGFASELGAVVTGKWGPSVTHMVCADAVQSATIKLLMSLMLQIPMIKMSWCEEAQHMVPGFGLSLLPLPERHFPRMNAILQKSELVSQSQAQSSQGASFDVFNNYLVDDARRTLFKDTVFLFVTHELASLMDAVQAGGGVAILDDPSVNLEQLLVEYPASTCSILVVLGSVADFPSLLRDKVANLVREESFQYTTKVCIANAIVTKDFESLFPSSPLPTEYKKRRVDGKASLKREVEASDGARHRRLPAFPLGNSSPPSGNHNEDVFVKSEPSVEDDGNGTGTLEQFVDPSLPSTSNVARVNDRGANRVNDGPFSRSVTPPIDRPASLPASQPPSLPLNQPPALPPNQPPSLPPNQPPSLPPNQPPNSTVQQTYATPRTNLPSQHMHRPDPNVPASPVPSNIEGHVHMPDPSPSPAPEASTRTTRRATTTGWIDAKGTSTSNDDHAEHIRSEEDLRPIVVRKKLVVKVQQPPVSVAASSPSTHSGPNFKRFRKNSIISHRTGRPVEVQRKATFGVPNPIVTAEMEADDEEESVMADLFHGKHNARKTRHKSGLAGLRQLLKSS